MHLNYSQRPIRKVVSDPKNVDRKRNTRKRKSYLEDRSWRPYRNSPELAERIYDLTHPSGAATFADIERSKSTARLLKPYQAAVAILSGALKDS